MSGKATPPQQVRISRAPNTFCVAGSNKWQDHENPIKPWQERKQGTELSSVFRCHFFSGLKHLCGELFCKIMRHARWSERNRQLQRLMNLSKHDQQLWTEHIHRCAKPICAVDCLQVFNLSRLGPQTPKTAAATSDRRRRGVASELQEKKHEKTSQAIWSRTNLAAFQWAGHKCGKSLSLMFPVCFSLPRWRKGWRHAKPKAYLTTLQCSPALLLSHKYGIYRSCFPCWPMQCNTTVVKASTLEVTGHKNWAPTGTLPGSCFAVAIVAAVAGGKYWGAVLWWEGGGALWEWSACIIHVMQAITHALVWHM